MEEKKMEQTKDLDIEVLITIPKDVEKAEPKVVKEVNEAGEIVSIPLKDATNNDNYMKFDRNLNPLENFWKNFVQKFKNPNDLIFFRTPEKKMKEVIKEISEHPEKAEEILKEYKIKPQEQKTYHKEEELPWEKLAQIGLFKDKIPASDLSNILNGNGSRYMYPVKINFGDIRIETDVKLNAWKDKEGKIVINLKGKAARPELDHYFNVKFDDVDKRNLETTGNLGRLVEVQYSKDSEPEKVYLSLDHLTDRIVAYKAPSLKLHDEAFGVDIRKHHEALKRGEIIHLDGMKRKDGTTFSGDIQVNAETRGVALVSYRKPLKQSNSIGGKDLTDEQQAILKEGGTIYLQGLICKDGSIRDGYFKLEKGATKFFDANDPNSYFLRDEVIKSQKDYFIRHGLQIPIELEKAGQGKTEEIKPQPLETTVQPPKENEKQKGKKGVQPKL